MLSVSLFFSASAVRRTRLWNDICQIEILISGQDENVPIFAGGAAIKLSFFSGGTAILNLKDFEADGVNTFVNALEEWATRCPPNKRLCQLPRLYELETSDADASRYKELSYTKFWEEQLKDNYTFTAFVPLTAGSTLRDNSLTIVKQIGSGGFSAIYLAQDDEKVQYVVKESVVPDHLDEEHKAKVKEHFSREAKILLKLSHDRIANVYDHFVEDDRDYLLLEYIEGKDAREVLSEKKEQDVQTVITWVQDIVDVLEYLHSQDPPVIHRDVTPDNMLIDNSGRMTLIDFGAANEYIGQATGTLVGKQSYMPPEQVRGKCTTASDIYGLGASMFFLLTGSDPEPLACSSPSRLRENLPKIFDELVQSCTRLEETERTGDVRDIRAQLDKLANTDTERASLETERSDLSAIGG